MNLMICAFIIIRYSLAQNMIFLSSAEGLKGLETSEIRDGAGAYSDRKILRPYATYVFNVSEDSIF